MFEEWDHACSLLHVVKNIYLQLQLFNVGFDKRQNYYIGCIEKHMILTNSLLLPDKICHCNSATPVSW